MIALVHDQVIGYGGLGLLALGVGGLANWEKALGWWRR